MLLPAYRPGSSMGVRYLEINGITGIAIWRDKDNPRLFRLASTTDDDGRGGFASTGPAMMLRTCKAQGEKISSAWGLKFHGLTA
jgi:hypothetical protein